MRPSRPLSTSSRRPLCSRGPHHKDHGNRWLRSCKYTRLKPLKHAEELAALVCGQCRPGAIREDELRRSEENPKEGEELLFTQRNQCLPILFYVQAAGSVQHMIKIELVKPTHDPLVGEFAFASGECKNLSQ